MTYTKKGFQKITVARYNSDDNSNILLHACEDFGVDGQTWVTCRVTCVSYTNGSVWYQYILRFYYVSTTTTFQQLFKIGGANDITYWNDYGTIISNMDDQNPHYCIELLETV